MILLIYGEEDFLTLKKLKQIKEKFVSSNTDDSNITEMDADSFSLEKFISLALSATFLTEKRLIILKNILSGKNKDIEGKILEHLSNLPESTVMLFYENKESLNSKNKLVQEVIKKSSKIWEFKKLNNWQIEKWLEKEISNKGGSISKLALSKLLAFVGNDLWQLNQESEKLVLYKNKKTIEETDIENLVFLNLNNNVFEFIDSIGQKNVKNSLRLLNNLIEQGEEIVYLLGMIVYQVRNLMIVKELSSKKLSKAEIVKITKKHPFVISKTLGQIENFTAENLEIIYNKIFDTEVKIKTGKLEPKTAINLLATSLCLK